MTAEKTARTTTVQHQAASGTFFRKAEDAGFFGSHEAPSFFGSAIQPKLTVSQPDDPQEREADAVADQVMRMPEPAAAAGNVQRNEEGGSTLMRIVDPVDMPISAPKDEEHNRLDRMDDGQETETSVQPRIMRKCEACEAEEKAQAKLMRMSADDKEEEAPAPGISRMAADNSFVYPKAHGPPASVLIQRSGRAPPAPDSSFQSSLQSTKGGGMPMSSDTRQSMESRFGADFGGVRIHTGTQAESLSNNIHAHAFTHGGDIYFNSGKYAPNTAEGSHLLAHELTHTIQQGASRPAQNTGTTVAPKLQRQITGHGILHRAATARPVPSQLTNAVAKAKGEEGKVNANKEGPDGFRTGWEHLVDYFKTTLGEDKVIPAGGTGSLGSVAEQDIKKKREIDGPVPAHPKREKKGPYMRDAMPSWCGIFVFWALHKAGVPMKPWSLGGRVVTPEAAYPPGYTPQAGDIAYRNDFSHFAIVEKASGDTITTVNGNTAGEDNLAGQVQTRDHPRSGWTAFFDPLMLKDGPLSSGETTAEAVKPLSIRELRKKLFGVDRKANGDPASQLSEDQEDKGSHAETETPVEGAVQAKPVLSDWSVNAAGALQRNAEPPTEEDKLQKKEDEKGEEDKIGGQAQLSIQKKATTNFDRQTDTAPGEAGNAIQRHPTPSGAVQTHPSGGRQSPASHLQLQASRGPPGQIQRSWLGDAWDAVGDAVNSAVEWAEDQINEAKAWILEQISDFVSNIPGFRMLTVILEENPITGAPVVRNGTTMLQAGLQILGPLGTTIETLLRRTNTFTEAAGFVEGRVDDFIGMASSIGSRFSSFIDGLSVTDIGHPQQVLDNVANLLHGVITDISGFIERTTTDFLAMVKRVMVTQVATFVRNRVPRLYPLLRVALGHDPVTNEDVPRNGANILNALFDVTDEGREQRRQLQETGTFQKVANWIDRGISVFSNLYNAIRTGFSLVWDAVSFDTLLHPVETFERIYNHFAQPIADVWAFVRDTALVIINFIKEALLSRLSAWARDQRGYFLITLLIHRDPFTNASVPFTIENVIHAFMSLMDGGEEQFQQMKQSGAIDRTTNRIMAAVRRLNFTVEYIVGLFMGLWRGLHLSDLANPPALFRRVIATFAQPVLRLVAFVVEIIKIVVEILLQVMQFPVDLINNIIARAMAAWDRIKRDPIGFLKNLLRAIKQGFIQFFDHVVDHLLYGLTGWLMAELRDAGVPELTDFSLRGVITWVLQVLGISMEAIWQKLAQHPRIGPERVARLRRVIGYAEGIWTFIKDVQERGIQAVWDKIQEQLTNLWDTILNAAKDWIMREIVDKITARLLSMLDPTGIMAVINSAIAIYRAVQSFVRYLRQILEVVNSFVEGVAQIAEGNITVAANFLEGTMRRAMPVVIGFLANQVGLSGIGHRIAELIGRGRELVDQALTWLVNKAVDTAFALFERLLAMGRSAANAVAGWLGLRKTFRDTSGGNHEVYFLGTGGAAQLYVASYNPRTIPTLLTAAGRLITQPANQQHRQSYDDAVRINGEVDVIKARLATPGGPTADADNQAMNEKLEVLATKLPPLMTMVGGTEPPPLVKPGFVNGAKASSFEVNYLKSGRTSGGSTADTNSGATLPGWSRLSTGGLTARSAWVKMHLLTEQLGGPALDTNLTPARGPETNLLAYREVEQHAIAKVNAGNTIWYKITIGYHGAPNEDYPNHIRIEYGPYDFNTTTNQWERKDRGTPVNGTPIGTEFFDQNPAEPNLSGTGTVPNINDPILGWRRILGLASGLSRPFAEFVVEARTASGAFTQNNLGTELNNHYRTRTLPIENFSQQVTSLVTAGTAGAFTF